MSEPLPGPLEPVDPWRDPLAAAHADSPPPADPHAWLDKDEFGRQTEAPRQPGRAGAQAVGLSASSNREPAAADVAKVARLLARKFAIGRVVGARPGDGTTCEVELVMLARVEDGYRLRTAVVGLDRLREVKDDLNVVPRPPALVAEDMIPDGEGGHAGGAYAGAGIAGPAGPGPGRVDWPPTVPRKLEAVPVEGPNSVASPAAALVIRSALFTQEARF